MAKKQIKNGLTVRELTINDAYAYYQIANDASLKKYTNFFMASSITDARAKIEKFTSHYEKRIINVHPSLIPSFCGEGFYGLHVHEAALEKGVKVTGATVHFVNEIPDGGEIIMQKAVSVHDGDTPEILQKRVMEEAEWIILPASVEKISKEIISK